jgi:hypothetical protein
MTVPAVPANRVSDGLMVKIMLSAFSALPKSKSLAQIPLLSDLHHIANVRPPFPVVKGFIFIY